MLQNKPLVQIPLFSAAFFQNHTQMLIPMTSGHSSFSRQVNAWTQCSSGSLFKNTGVSYHWTRIVMVHGILNRDTGPKSLKKNPELFFQPLFEQSLWTTVLGYGWNQLRCLSNTLLACPRGSSIWNFSFWSLQNFSFHFQLIFLAKLGSVYF